MATQPAEPNELHPVFTIAVDLDGLDDAAIQTGNAKYALEVELARMKAVGIIRDYTLEVRP